MRHPLIALGLALALLSIGGSLFAQNELDAYRYMTPTSVGTARALGMAGAFSAVGADFTATSLNPAGLGLYRKSEFMLTPAVRLVRDKTNYLDGSNQNSYGKFGFSNVGYVYATPVYKWDPQTRSREEARSGLKSYAFSIGYNQIAQMGRTAQVSAFNPNSSITQYFASEAQGKTVTDIEADNGYAGQAWWAYAIDTSGANGDFVGAGNGGQVQQTVNLKEVGRTNEWTVGFAANLNDKLYFGGTLGIQDLKYSQEQVFQENDIRDVHHSWANDSTPYYSSTFTTGFQTKGSGVNLRVGMIAKPTDFLRVGVSVTTPTAVQCVDRYYSSLLGYLDSAPTTAETKDVPDGAFAYTFTNPFKATIGAMALLGKRGFVSADFDYIDYTTAKFKTKSGPGSSYYYSFRDENNAIRDLFAGAYNLRLGGELRFASVGRARLGYGHYGSILKKDYLNYFPFPVDPVSPTIQKIRGGKDLFSLGLGIKQKSFYLDLAFVHETTAERKLLYTLPDPAAYSPELIQHIASNNIYMTIGFTF